MNSQIDAENILKGLNSDQRAAVLHDHEKGAQLLILAGAGSGKTSVLTKRIQFRILCGVEPDKILALTFTAKAAAEMRERVQQLFPGAGVRLCTFHSLALYILKSKVPTKNGEIFAYEILGFKKMPSPAENSDKDFLKALAQVKLKSPLNRENLFADFYSESELKKLKPLREAVLKSGQVVFEDLIYLAIHLLENFEEVCQFFRAQWQEILVDEYQDINPTQYRMVKGILGNRKSLFVVGDDDQAIYGFRGADIGNINRFRDDFKESTLIRLEWNYRSVPNILHLANDIFKNKPLHLQKVLRAGNGNGSHGNPIYKENRKPVVWVSENPVEEIQKIVTSILELKEAYDLEWKNFAILVRYNRQRLYYEQALREVGFPIAGDPIKIDAQETLEVSFCDESLKKSSENSPEEEPELLVENGIHVETVHASKGLQYAVVYYAGLCEKLTPGDCKGNKKQRRAQLEEERRLYYVGVTRAEACLFLLYCKKRFWKGKLRRFKRSRFLPPPKISRESKMPLFIYRIYVLLRVLAYMVVHMASIPFVKLKYKGRMDVWIDSKVQEFARLCMRILRVDLTIDNQAVLGQVDWNRPVFVIGNHGSFADIPLIFLAVEKTVGFVAKKSLGYIPFLHFWMNVLGCLLVDRGKDGAAKAVRKAIAERSKGLRIVIFPEGTRSKTGAMGNFKSGAFRFATENDGILLPVVIKGSGFLWERRTSSKPCKVHIKVLAPIDVLNLKNSKEKFNPRVELQPMVQALMAKELEEVKL